MQTINRPILVTGAHRSGTTWVGNMISKSKEVCYIKEPFSIHHRPGICNAKFDFHFTHVDSDNEERYYKYFQDTINFKFNFIADIKSVRNFNHLKKLLKNYYCFKKGSLRNARPLFKDPLAVFSSDWLAKTFNFQVIVLVRHPAAFISSLKRLELYHPFSHFNEQHSLISGYLSEFKEIIGDYSDMQLKSNDLKVPDIIDQGVLLWNIIYSFINKMKEKHPEWIVIKHEDISLYPEKYFSLIFNYLNLKLEDKALETILSFSNSKNPIEIEQNKWHQLKRNSKENIFNWKKRLTTEEIDRIQKGTEKIFPLFYDETFFKI